MLILINLYIIIKDNHNNNDDGDNAQNKDNNKYWKIFKKDENENENDWLFSREPLFFTITITITRNKTLITN